MNSEGIGLGLTIVKQIIQASDGSIDVLSPGIGKGTTVRFTLALEPENSYQLVEDATGGSFLNFVETPKRNDLNLIGKENS